MQQIAAFLGVTLSDAELAKVSERCSLPHMKAHPELFGYRLPLNPAYEGTVMNEGAMTRKGGVGEGKRIFTDEQKARWAKIEEEELPDAAMRTWAREGGAL